MGLVYCALPVCFVFEILFVYKYFNVDTENIEGDDNQGNTTPRYGRPQNGLTLSAIEKKRQNEAKKVRDGKVEAEMKKWEEENPKGDNKKEYERKRLEAKKEKRI